MSIIINIIISSLTSQIQFELCKLVAVFKLFYALFWLTKQAIAVAEVVVVH